jgi:hypothetical protein
MYYAPRTLESSKKFEEIMETNLRKIKNENL